MRHNFYSMRLACEQERRRKCVVRWFATRTARPRTESCGERDSATDARAAQRAGEGAGSAGLRAHCELAILGSAVRGGAFAPSQQRTARLVHFGDACAFDHGRFPLALGKLFGALAVYINAGELLAVSVIDGDLPVLVLAALVARPFGRLGRAFLFHWLETSVNVRLISEYVNFGSSRQVTILCV